MKQGSRNRLEQPRRRGGEEAVVGQRVGERLSGLMEMRFRGALGGGSIRSGEAQIRGRIRDT